ncbi:MAG: cation transporter, partial [Eubacteriaceae bacterium]|nr:cation transporter [Eubacteriaceae bacterium]
MTEHELTRSAEEQASSREKTIIKTSIIGIVANVFLAAFKAVVGLLSHSIAIVLDAVNNISDAG